jgi:hypothetical protein
LFGAGSLEAGATICLLRSHLINEPVMSSEVETPCEVAFELCHGIPRLRPE